MGDEFEVVYSSWYNTDLEDLPRQQASRIEKKIRTMRRKGWRDSLGDRTVTPLRDGIHELRVIGKGPAYRVLFFVVPGRSPRVVVLTACVAKSVMKKRQRFDTEVDRAVERRSIWLAQYGK